MTHNGEQADSALPENDSVKKRTRKLPRVLLIGCGLAAVVFAVIIIGFAIPILVSLGIIEGRFLNVTCSPRGSTLGSGDERLAFIQQRQSGGSLAGDYYVYSVYVLNADGSCQRLTDNGGPAFDWSPDGSKIAFERMPDKTSLSGDIYIMDTDGTHEAQLTNIGEHFLEPTWSPDGQYILLESVLQIHVLDPKDGSMTLLSDSASDPVWAPDGQHIAFYENEDDTDWLSVIDVDSGEKRRLAEGKHEMLLLALGRQIAWSPDGQQIAFGLGGIGSASVHVINADGSDLRVLAEGGDPVWSPDGQRIAFEGRYDERAFAANDLGRGLYIINADGSDLRLLAEGGDPVWSPDSQQIAFETEDGINVISADGSSLRLLAEGGNPVWSPDVQQIAFGCGGDICVSDADGGDLRHIVKGGGPVSPVSAAWPLWAPR